MIGTVARSGDPQPRQKAGLFIVISVSAQVGSVPFIAGASIVCFDRTFVIPPRSISLPFARPPVTPVLWTASTMASYSRHKALDFAQVFHRISHKLE